MVKIPAWNRHLLKATLLVALVISVAKFLEGAWIVMLLIPLLVVAFMSTCAFDGDTDSGKRGQS